MFFLVPDGPGLAEAIKGTAAIPVVESRQTTNSWGLRGPEPDLDAPVRGIVLGDSFMQGMFIGDDDTPPECLQARSRRPPRDQGVDPQHRRISATRPSNTITRSSSSPIAFALSSSS